jgi:hypothetical protein
MKNFAKDGIAVRRKYTTNGVRAYLDPHQAPWYKPGTIVLKSEDGEYIQCVTPETLVKSYKSTDPDFKEFILKATELFS